MYLKSLITALLVVATAARPVRPMFAAVDPLDEDVSIERESLEEAAAHLRNIVYRQNLLTLSTIDSDGYPTGQMEYYADCGLEDASLATIRLNISSAYRNIAAGSPATASVRLGDVSPYGHVPDSPASAPRATLFGSFSKVFDEDEIAVLQKCFLKQHPDAHAWLPGNQVHDADWVKFDISKIYYIGGFGNVAYIGDIPLDLYLEQTPTPSKHSKGRHGRPHPPPPPPPPPFEDFEDEMPARRPHRIPSPFGQWMDSLLPGSGKKHTSSHDDEEDCSKSAKPARHGKGHRGSRGRHGKAQSHSAQDDEEKSESPLVNQQQQQWFQSLQSILN